MSELTQKQIQRLRAIADYKVQPYMLASDAAALLAVLAELDRRGQEIERSLDVLAPSMRSSGLEDACRQVKQAAISWEGNCETVESERDEARAEVARQQGELAASKQALVRAAGLISEGDVALEKVRAERDRAQEEAKGLRNRPHRCHKSLGRLTVKVAKERERAEAAERALAAANAKMEKALSILRRIGSAPCPQPVYDWLCDVAGVERDRIDLLSTTTPGESVSVQEPERETEDTSDPTFYCQTCDHRWREHVNGSPFGCTHDGCYCSCLPGEGA